jgi:hypothetical protein
VLVAVLVLRLRSNQPPPHSSVTTPPTPTSRPSPPLFRPKPLLNPPHHSTLHPPPHLYHPPDGEDLFVLIAKNNTGRLVWTLLWSLPASPHHHHTARFRLNRLQISLPTSLCGFFCRVLTTCPPPLPRQRSLHEFQTEKRAFRILSLPHPSSRPSYHILFYLLHLPLPTYPATNHPPHHTSPAPKTTTISSTYRKEIPVI